MNTERHHFALENGRIVIREPERGDKVLVCTLSGDPTCRATILQARVICRSLDRLAEKLKV